MPEIADSPAVLLETLHVRLDTAIGALLVGTRWVDQGGTVWDVEAAFREHVRVTSGTETALVRPGRLVRCMKRLPCEVQA